jgi:hypothetical protein
MRLKRRHRDVVLAVITAAPVLSCAGSAVAAEELVSAFTSTKPALCRKTNSVVVACDEYASTRVCPGKAGYVVIVHDDDLRTTVTVMKTGKTASKAVVAGSGSGGFSSVHDAVEWRSVKGAAEPFAVILRWSVGDPDNATKDGYRKDLPFLFVARLAPGPICTVAYVDTTAKQDSNALARRAADERARDFKCATDTVQRVGARGRASEVFTP